MTPEQRAQQFLTEHGYSDTIIKGSPACRLSDVLVAFAKSQGCGFAPDGPDDRMLAEIKQEIIQRMRQRAPKMIPDSDQVPTYLVHRMVDNYPIYQEQTFALLQELEAEGIVERHSRGKKFLEDHGIEDDVAGHEFKWSLTDKGFCADA